MDIFHPHTTPHKTLQVQKVWSKYFGNHHSLRREDDGFYNVRADGFEFWSFPELDTAKTYRDVSSLPYKDNSEFIQGETRPKPEAEIGHATESITGPKTP